MRKIWKQAIAWLIVFTLILSAGCTPTEPEATVPSGTQPSLPPQSTEQIGLYVSACQAAQTAGRLVHDFRFSETRVISGESFQKSGTGTAIYENLGKDNFQALIREQLTFGSFASDYTQSYIDGRAYIQAGEASFTSPLTAEQFLSCQTPAVLIDPSLYQSNASTALPSGGYQFRFSQPTGFAGWMMIHEEAQLISCEATATVDAQGMLRDSRCQIQYQLKDMVCTLEVSSVLSYLNTHPLSELQPQYGENCVQLEAFLAPRLILQTMGMLNSSGNFTCVQTQSAYCEAAGVLRKQQLQIDLVDSDSDFMAKASYAVNVTNYTGAPTTNTQTETFLDGKYHYTINNSEPVYQENITAEKMRDYCRESALYALLALENLTGATVTDTGDFYCIQFTCAESTSDPIFSEVFKLLNLNLDSFSQSVTTQTPTAYLTVSKYTGLPVTMGKSFTRNHVIDEVSYRTTFQVDQTISLPSSSAYSAITGQEPAPEEAPEAKATPLFYKISDKRGRTLWLLGTIHVGDNRTGFLPQEIYDAFTASHSLAVEFDTDAFLQMAASDSMLQAQLSSSYFYSDGSATLNHIPSELHQKAYALILASGSNTMDVPYMRPIIWESMLGSFFLEQSGTLSAEKGMENRLLALAKEQGKTVENIESGLSQMKTFLSLSDQLQTMLLEDTVSSSLAEYCAEMEKLYEVWCSGDAAALAAALTEDTSNMTEEELKLYQEYYKTVITNRNSVMLKAAKNYIKSGKTVFFAVGAAHVVGAKGLAALLKSAGYKVEQVTYAQ